MKLGLCHRLDLRPINATWYRAIATEYFRTPLKTDQTSEYASRFHSGSANSRRFEILYLAENQVVALYEVGALFGPPAQPLSNPHARRVLHIDVQVTLQRVADLTDPVQQALLGVSTQLLTGHWDIEHTGPAPTQQLGAALFATPGVEGFLAISSKMPLCKTLIVFPKKLLKGSEISYKDTISARGKTHRITP